MSSHDVNGNLLAVSESFKTSKNRSFVTDQSGTILQKTENGKTQNYFYAGALSDATASRRSTPGVRQAAGFLRRALGD